MSARGSTRHWLTLNGVATLAMSVAMWADHQPFWVVAVLALMGAVTVAGGVVQAREAAVGPPR